MWQPPFTICRSARLLVLCGLLNAAHRVAAAPNVPQQTWQHGGAVYQVAFSPDGRMVASGGEHGLKLWNTRSGRLQRALTWHADTIIAVAFSPDGRILASGGTDNLLRLWDVRTGKLRHVLRGHSTDVQSIAFAPDGKTLVSGSSEEVDEDTSGGQMKLWDARSGRLKRTLSNDAGVEAVAFAPDGETAVGARGGLYQLSAVQFWNVRTGRERRRLTLGGKNEDVEPKVTSLAFSPDGRTLAIASVRANTQTSAVKLWNARTKQLKRSLRVRNELIAALAFSPNGRMLAGAGGNWTGEKKGEIEIWSVRTGQRWRGLNAHKQAVFGVAFAPNGQTLASGSLDGTVKLWRLK